MSVDLSTTTDLTQPDDERDPELVEAIQRAVRGELALVRTACPGIVQAYDAATQRATIQAGVQLRLADGSTVAEPVFADVPVVFPGAGGYSLSWPLVEGDEVLVLFCERSIDEWLERGGYDQVAQDPRRFSGQDAIALPGLRSAPNKLAGSELGASALTLASADGATRIEVREGGVVTITAAEVRLGDDTAAALALAAPVQEALNALYLAVTAIYTWGAGVTPPLPAGPDFPGDLGPPPAPPIPPVVAATKAKGV